MTEDHLSPVRRLKGTTPLLFVTLFIVVAGKNSFDEIFYPLLYNEDGRYVFPAFFRHQDISAIFSKLDSGYLHVMPYFIAYFIGYLPVIWIPTAYSMASLFTTAAVFFIFYFVLIRCHVLPAIAFFIVLFLAALPLGNAPLSKTLAFQHYHGVTILMLLQFLPLPQNRLKRIFYFCCVHMLIWSHPLSVVLAPAYIYRVVRERDGRIMHVLCLLSIFVYLILGTHGARNPIGDLDHYAGILMQRVVLETLVGVSARGFLQFLGLAGWLSTGVVLAMVFLLWGTWKERSAEEKYFFLMALYFILATTFIAVSSRQLGEIYQLFQGRSRYVYIQKILFAGMFVLSLFPVSVSSAKSVLLRFVFFAILLGVNGYRSHVYWTDSEDSKRVQAFTRLIEEERKHCVPGDEKILSLDRGIHTTGLNEGIWSINVKVCG